MPCKNCKTKPVVKLTNSPIALCKSCFFKYFERKVFKTIRQYNLVNKGETIAVACSGGKDSTTVLHLLNKLAERKMNIKVIAISVEEGIKKYRANTINTAKKYCKEHGIKHYVYSFKEEYGLTMDQIARKIKGVKPCTFCGVLRRSILNKKARQLKADKLATGHNLDDEAQSILMNQFRRNIEVSARLGPITGVVFYKKFVKRIKPLYFLLEKETELYAKLKNISKHKKACPYKCLSFRDDVRNMLNSFEKRHPGTKHSIIGAFLEILPILKEKYKSTKKINLCKKCKEPCSQDICQMCKLLASLKK